MRTLPDTTNQPLRDALAIDPDAIEVLLASTLALVHDGTLELDEDGRLPKGEALPLGISRASDGTYLIATCTDPDAIAAPDAPTMGPDTPYVPIAGDDLVMLAAANHVGLHVNPGSTSEVIVPSERLREVASRLRSARAVAGVRSYDDRTLVTLRSITPNLSPERHALLRRELWTRGVAIAFVAEYALHDQVTTPDTFTQLIVVGDEEGFADYDMREDARRVLDFLTGRSTDSVAFAAMPQVQHVVKPVMQLVDELPAPLMGVV